MSSAMESTEYDHEQYSVLIAIERGAVTIVPPSPTPRQEESSRRPSLGELDRSGRFMH